MKLQNVITSCGCTAPSWSATPILPGEKGKIELNYHAGPAGEFIKYVAVLVAGENRPIQLEIKGNVFAR